MLCFLDRPVNSLARPQTRHRSLTLCTGHAVPPAAEEAKKHHDEDERYGHEDGVVHTASHIDYAHPQDNYSTPQNGYATHQINHTTPHTDYTTPQVSNEAPRL